MLALFEYFWDTAAWTDTSRIIAETGSFNITGQAVTLKINFVSGQGSHVGTGQAGVLNIGMPANAGVFALTGFDVGLTSSSPVEPAAQPQGAGGGSRLNDEFWAIRERYIERMLQVEDVEVSHAPTVEQLESIDALSDGQFGSQPPLRDIRPTPYASVSLERALELQTRAVYLAREARTRAELKRVGELVAATSHTIARLKDQHETENLAAVMALMF